jgi:hypothetical protein
MPAPVLQGPDAQRLHGWMAEVEDRLAAAQTPKGPQLAFVTTAAGLTAASAAELADRWVVVSDLKTIAYSTGAHWIRVDTGAVIA